MSKTKYNKDISNSYSYGGGPAYTVAASTKKENNLVACRHCGWRLRSINGKVPEICESCHRDPVTGEEIDTDKFFHNELGDDSVKPSTHIQIKWNCKSCGHFGIKWISKKDKRVSFACPQCDSTKVHRSTIPANGRSRSLWGNSTPVKREAVKNNAMYCAECGHHNMFKFVPPIVCNHCGTPYNKQEE